MKRKTIEKAFSEIWHTIRLRKEYYDKLSKKNDSERVLTLKLEYEEHYNRGYREAKRKAINKTKEYLQEIEFEDIATNTPKSPEYYVIKKLLEEILKI